MRNTSMTASKGYATIDCTDDGENGFAPRASTLGWMGRSFWPSSGCTLKKGPPTQRPSSTRGNSRARKSAAHNLNDTIAVGALIQIKTPQMALFRVTEVTANVVISNYGLGMLVLLFADQKSFKSSN
jgi:hypothetical protein